MLKARLKEEKIFKFIGYKDGEVLIDFQLAQKKLLVGSCPTADLKLDDNTISHYHAFIVVDDNGGKIIDLDSENGVYLNGERVKNSYFSDGDILRIGGLELNVQEDFVEVQRGIEVLKDQDAGRVEKISEDLVKDLPSELPPVPGLVVIDGEYCDIVFDDDNFSPLHYVPATDESRHYNEFIDVEEKADLPKIARKNEALAIEVTVMTRGNVLSIDYFPLKDKTYYISPKARNRNSIVLPCLESEDRVPFINISNGQIELQALDKFHGRNLNNGQDNLFSKNDSYQFNEKDIISFDHGTNQVIVRLVDAPPHLRAAPFFGRDRDFQKQTSKIFGVLMSIFLLLLFIDTTVEPPKKKIAVIYRKAIKSKKQSDTKSKSIADKVNKDTGVKKENQPKKETKMAKKSPTKSKVKKKATKKPKKMAKAAPAPKAKPKKPKMKAYEFKSKTSLSSLFGSTKSMKNVKVNKKSLSGSAVGSASVAQASDSALKATNNANVGTLGRDFSGNYDSSTGTKGLSSKSGIDTTYSDPKTVVLGSMDPELLRKILKEYLPQFRHCYQKELEVNEGAKGVIDLTFRINGNGSVSNIKVKGKKARLTRSGTNCMSKVLAIIPFPKPKGGGVVDVRQPLNFFSEQDKY